MEFVITVKVIKTVVDTLSRAVYIYSEVNTGLLNQCGIWQATWPCLGSK